MSLIALDFDCPACGLFDLTVERPAPDSISCPTCGESAPSVLSPLRIKRQLVLDVNRGKSDPAPSPLYLDTEPLADGMDPVEFDARRAKVWEDEAERKIKRMVS